MNVISYIKKFIFNGAYLRLYPMTQNENIVSAINNCDFKEDTQFTRDILTLVRYITSNIALDDIDIDITERGLQNCYRTKKVKVKDEETDEKVVEKVRVEKKGEINKRNIERLNKNLDGLSDNSEQLEKLGKRILDNNIRAEDLPLCDKVLKSNRFATRFYVALIVVAVIAFAFLYFIL